MTNAHPGRILPQDMLAPDGAGVVLAAQPISQAEIEDLLYGDDRPAEERITRLQELAASLGEQQPADFGDGDANTLIGEIEEAISRLSGGLEPDPGDDDNTSTMDDDPLNHRETLSPDSDELAAIEADDVASVKNDGVLDPVEWEDGDGFDTERGVK